MALPRPVSATSTEPVASLASFRTGSGVLNAVAWGASTCSARAVADVARLTSIGAPVLSRLGETETAEPGGSPTGESDRSAQPHYYSKSLRALHPPPPSQGST